MVIIWKCFYLDTKQPIKWHEEQEEYGYIVDLVTRALKYLVDSGIYGHLKKIVKYALRQFKSLRQTTARAPCIW